ncbi:MAG: TerD family protein [Micrococcales bacterium]|nr:TerD family protein [Micrococcales bacterium]
MVTRLQAGQNVALARVLPGASRVAVGLGWNLVQGSGPQTDVVPAVIALGQDRKAVSPQHVAFFNQLTICDDAVGYEADGRLSGGDRERVAVDLAAVPPNVVTLVFVLYVNPDLRNPGTFDSLRSGHVRLVDRSGVEVVRYDIDTKGALGLSALVCVELYRHQSAWKLRAVGQGFTGGVREVATVFGLP